jgi:hypothetical protein
MNITTNNIGNYGPSFVNKTQQIRTDSSIKKQSEKVSVEEKKFFADMYPDKKSEIMDYQFYNSKGKIPGVQLGSLFDRRG